MRLGRFLPAVSPVFLLSTLLLVFGASAAWYVQNLSRDISTVLDLNVASVRAAEELEIGLREIRSRLNDLIYRGNSLDDLAKVTVMRENTDRWLREADKLATTTHEQEIMRRLKAGYTHFFAELDETLKTHEEGSRRTDIRELIDVILTKEIIEPAHEYLDYNEGTMFSVAQQHRVFSKRFSMLLLAIGVCGSLGGFLAGVLASRRLRRTMVELDLPLSLAADKLSEVAGPIRFSTSLDLNELKRVLEAVAVEVDRVVARLHKSQQEVLRSEKLAAIGQLAAGTAHEIRNPLMSIKLLVQSALAQPEATPLAGDDLRLIDQEVCRLERTVQNLLDFARPPAIACQTFPLQRLVRHCIDLVSGRAAIQRVAVESRSLVEADLMVEGDYQQLQQVLLNLLINSLDATPSGGKIAVDLERKTADAYRVLVSDTGQGIPEKLLPVLFEPFASSKESGTGLGLSISKQIVEAHKGEIFARNRDICGALVGFSLPAKFAGGEHHAYQ